MAKKPETEEKNKGGRPRAEINQKQFEQLCAIQCTRDEICAVLDVTDKTLDKWCKDVYGVGFSAVYKQKREGGKASLRASGFRMAQKNPAVHIFYAKNHLGMSDKVETEFNPESLVKAKELLGVVNSVID